LEDNIKMRNKVKNSVAVKGKVSGFNGIIEVNDYKMIILNGGKK